MNFKTGYFGLHCALTTCKVAWDLVRRAGHRVAQVARLGIVCDAVDFVVAMLTRKGLMPNLGKSDKYHPEQVKSRLRSGACACAVPARDL